jgi:hypothetical protein
MRELIFQLANEELHMVWFAEGEGEEKRESKNKHFLVKCVFLPSFCLA